MGFWEKLWNDIRPNLVWYLLTLLFGGAMTKLISWIGERSDTPITSMWATIIFLVSAVIAAVGITAFFVIKKRMEHVTDGYGLIYFKLSLAALAVVAISLIGWNIFLQSSLSHLEAKVEAQIEAQTIRVKHLEVQMIRYVLPRQLTKEQIDAFGQYLKVNSKPHEVKIKYIMGDAEAQAYASDFAAAFKAGNWVPNMMAVNPVSITCKESPHGNTVPFVCSTELQQMINSLEGITIQQTGPNPPQPSTLEEKLNPPKNISDIALEALNAAGISGIGGGYSYNNDPLNTITVYIGYRKRDKFAVFPKKSISDGSIQDITDDDF